MKTYAPYTQSEEGLDPRGFPPLLNLPHVEGDFHRGARIYAFDDPANHIYLVISGRVKIVRASVAGRNKIIAIRHRGDIFGELALAGSRVEPRRSDEAVALERTRVAIIRTEDFWQTQGHNPAVWQHLLWLLATRLVEAYRQIEGLVFEDTQHRLAHTLLDLSRAASRAGETRLRLIHTELAELIGSSREVVTSLMLALSKRGLLDYRRGEIQPHLPQLAQFLSKGIDSTYVGSSAGLINNQDSSWAERQTNSTLRPKSAMRRSRVTVPD